MNLPLWRRKQKEELDEELRAHHDAAVQERLERGASPAEAQAAARREFGNSGLVAEITREMWGWASLDRLLQDLRYGLRQLRRAPGFTAVAVVTLALGIGVNTALFTGFNLILRPKPIKDPHTLLGLKYQGTEEEDYFSFPDYVYIRDHTQVFSEVIAVQAEKFLLGKQTPGAEPEEVDANFVSDKFFATLGGQTLLGRFFASGENRLPGQDAVVVLSHHFWQRRFAADREIIGRTLRLNGKPFTVVGVTSPEFVGLSLEIPDIWLPLMARPTLATVSLEKVVDRDWFGKQDLQWLQLYARLKPGKTPSQAQAEMTLLLSQLTRLDGQAELKNSIKVIPISDLSDRGFRSVLAIMAAVLAASGLVLLIACTNIANMLLARAAARQKEIGVRLCLGASRSRVIRQLLTGSFLLATLGGAAGVLLAWWSLRLLIVPVLSRYSYNLGDLTKIALDFSPDLRVLAFALLVSFLSGVAFGLAPALWVTRPDLLTVIKDEGAGVSSRIARSWLRSGLVVAQISLCLTLLIPAGLLLRSVSRVLDADPGFEAEKLLFVAYSLRFSGYDQPRADLFQRQLVSRLAALPGVQSVTPERDFGGRATITLLGKDGTSGRQFDYVPFQWVTANYLETIGTPLVQGRGFTAEEVESQAPVAIVSESMARNVWPGESPLGKTLRADVRAGPTTSFQSCPCQARIIGVARDNQVYRVGQTPPHFFYLPRAQHGRLDKSLLVRTAGDAAGMKEAVRKATLALEPVPRLRVITMAERIARNENVSTTRAVSELAAGLGGLALALAAIGIYGVMAYTVSRRRHEIGIRMALGADAREVLKLVLNQGLQLVLLGTVIGLAASLAVTQAVTSLLFGLSTIDPATYASVTLLLALVALLACYLPARRATKVDPMVALRHE